MAARHEEHEDFESWSIIKAILKKTSIHKAAQTGMNNYIEFMLRDINHDVDARNRNGMTALHFAVKANNVPLVRLLLRYDASMDARSKDARIPLDLCNPRTTEGKEIDDLLAPTYGKRRVMEKQSAGTYGSSMFQGHESKHETYGIKNKDMSLESMEELDNTVKNLLSAKLPELLLALRACEIEYDERESMEDLVRKLRTHYWDSYDRQKALNKARREEEEAKAEAAKAEAKRLAAEPMRRALVKQAQRRRDGWDIKEDRRQAGIAKAAAGGDFKRVRELLLATNTAPPVNLVATQRRGADAKGPFIRAGPRTGTSTGAAMGRKGQGQFSRAQALTRSQSQPNRSLTR
jgi:hypothetical protein